jgi:hypothetical protein
MIPQNRPVNRDVRQLAIDSDQAINRALQAACKIAVIVLDQAIQAPGGTFSALNTSLPSFATNVLPGAHDLASNASVKLSIASCKLCLSSPLIVLLKGRQDRPGHSA